MKAFPTTYRNYDESISHDCTGMNLRDYFAAKAMEAIIIYDQGSFAFKAISEDSYKMADAMMKARNDS
jgi:hypothetical protein